MADDEFIAYLKTLKSEDWGKMATDKWAVKDVVAHMVGWERQDPKTLRESWEKKEVPWWIKERNFDEFNQRSVEDFKDHTPEKLIAEWGMWQKKVQEEIDRIGYDNLCLYPDVFDYFISGRVGKHYQHHLNQIKRAIKLK